MGANLQRCLKASTAVQVVEVAGRRGHKEHELGRESFVYGLSLSTSSIPSPSEYPAVTEDYDTPALKTLRLPSLSNIFALKLHPGLAGCNPSIGGHEAYLEPDQCSDASLCTIIPRRPQSLGSHPPRCATCQRFATQAL